MKRTPMTPAMDLDLGPASLRRDFVMIQYPQEELAQPSPGGASATDVPVSTERLDNTRNQLISRLANIRRDLWRASSSLTHSQQWIADRTGMHRANVARFEAGRVDPRLSTLQKYVAALDMRLLLVVMSKSGEAVLSCDLVHQETESVPVNPFAAGVSREFSALRKVTRPPQPSRDERVPGWQVSRNKAERWGWDSYQDLRASLDAAQVLVPRT